MPSIALLVSYPDFRHEWIERTALIIETAAVVVIIAGIVLGTVFAVRSLSRGEPRRQVYHRFKEFVARTLLLGLEILVAGDIVHTVAVETTLESIGVLALLVVVRTFLSWAIIVEIEGRWPWQRPQPTEFHR
jgi:uncharacterized membrane protein